VFSFASLRVKNAWNFLIKKRRAMGGFHQSAKETFTNIEGGRFLKKRVAKKGKSKI